MKESKTTLENKGYKARAMSREFSMKMDRPIEEGGNNTAPTPVDYLLAAIGGCVAMTLRVFVNHKGWDVGEITVNVTQKEKLTPDGVKKYLTEEITVENEVTDEQKRKLQIMAGKCPVAQMIKKETKIETKIV